MPRARPLRYAWLRMIRMANWQIRVVLPTLIRVARDSPAPNRELDLVIAEMTALAHVRGLSSTLAALERENERHLAAVAKKEPRRSGARSSAVAAGG